MNTIGTPNDVDVLLYVNSSRYIIIVRAIPFEYTWGGGGGGNAHLFKNHGERGSRLKKNNWARGLSNIEKHGAGGGGYQAKKITSGVGYIYILKFAGQVPRHCHKMLYTPS